jgi:hypothetical protein
LRIRNKPVIKREILYRVRYQDSAQRRNVVDVTEGNRQLAGWLARTDTPSQRSLARRLPRVTQPMLSRHAKEGVPTLRAIFIYQALAGIPAEAWLSADDLALVDQVREEFGLDGRSLSEASRVGRKIAGARHALLSYLARSDRTRRGRLTSALRSLLAAEADLAQVGVSKTA